MERAAYCPENEFYRCWAIKLPGRIRHIVGIIGARTIGIGYIIAFFNV
jgi:hypothetical protein